MRYHPIGPGTERKIRNRSPCKYGYHSQNGRVKDDLETANPPPHGALESPSKNPADNSPPIITENQQEAENDAFGEEEAAPKATLLARLRATGARIIQGRGVAFKKGRGRPRNDGLPGPTDTVIGTEAPPGEFEIPLAGFDRPGGDPAATSLCRRSVIAAVKAGQWFAREVIRIKADAAGIDSGFVETALAKCEPAKGALEDFQTSLDAVLKKHNWRPVHDEEWALVIDAGRLFAPYGLLLATFNAEIKRRRAEQALPPPKPKEETK